MAAPLKSRDFHREYGVRTPTFMAYELRLLWHMHSNFYGIQTPTFMPYEPFLLGVGLQYIEISHHQKRSVWQRFSQSPPDMHQNLVKHLLTDLMGCPPGSQSEGSGTGPENGKCPKVVRRGCKRSFGRKERKAFCTGAQWDCTRARQVSDGAKDS